MPRDPEGPRSRRSACASLRFLFRTPSASLGPEWLAIVRDPRRSPEQLDVDEVLERLELVGIPDEALTVAIVRRSNGRAHFEVRVTMSAVVEVLAPQFPDVADAIAARSTPPEPAPD